MCLEAVILKGLSQIKPGAGCVWHSHSTFWKHTYIHIYIHTYIYIFLSYHQRCVIPSHDRNPASESCPPTASLALGWHLRRPGLRRISENHLMTGGSCGLGFTRKYNHLTAGIDSWYPYLPSTLNFHLSDLSAFRLRILDQKSDCCNFYDTSIVWCSLMFIDC